TLLGVAERRLVAVVAVGERDRGRAEALAGGPNRGISRLVLPDRRDPQSMPDARPIHELHSGCRVGDVLQPTGNPPGWIVPDAHDRARVHAGRSQEPVAILAR